MNFLNLGIGEILFILVITLIIFGPGNIVKTARDLGVFLRKVVKSPYWQEVWATKRELSEIPKILSKEARLDETIGELDRESKGIESKLTSSVKDFIKEIDETYPADKAVEQMKIVPDNITNPQKSKTDIAKPVSSDKPGD